MKFTPADGKIEIRTRNDAEGQLVVEVVDSGVGIDPGQAGRIFEAFEQGERTVTRTFGGLGLGLAISRSLVQMHGGTIEALSEGKGKGATFRVTLKPATPAQTADPVRTAEKPKPPQGLRILLVDDHEDTRRILQALLQKRGHRVRTATTVATGVAALREEEFEVLISDIGLPDGSGHELMKQAREIQPSVRGVALSGFGMEEDLRRSEQAGFEIHLTKPIDINTLETRLARAG